jgi:predicted ATPase
LDNAEHLIAAGRVPSGSDGKAASDLPPREFGTVVNDLLTAAPRVKVIVTSRVRLNLLGEHVFSIGPLCYPNASEATVKCITETPAVRLFLRSARQVLPGFTLHEANAGSVAKVCRLVQGHPLALLLSAVWVSTLSVEEITTALASRGADAASQSLDLLEAPWRNVPQRHQSFRAVFDGSWRLLPPHLRTVLAALSVFPGGFTSAAAREVVNATLQDVRGLIDTYLVSRTMSGRYAMHQLVRQCALEKLQRDPVVARRVYQRRCNFYARAVERWSEDIRGPRQQIMLAEMDAEIENVRASWDWAVQHGDIGFVDQAGLVVCLYYARRAKFQEATDVCAAAVERLEALLEAGGTSRAEVLPVLSEALYRYSWFFPSKRRVAAARRSLQLLDAPELADCDVRIERAGALRALGDQLLVTDRPQAMQLYRRSLKLYRAVGMDWEVSGVLTDLGICSLQLGALAEARAYLDEAVKLARALDDVRSIVRMTAGLAGVAVARGELDEAVRLSEGALASARELGATWWVVSVMNELALPLVLLARFEEAIHLLEESLLLSRDHLGVPTAHTESRLAWALMFSGRYAEAEELARPAVQFMRSQRDPRGLGWAQLVLGGILLGQARFTEAEEALAASVEGHRSHRHPMWLGCALAMLSQAHTMLGALKQARQDLVDALNRTTETTDTQSTGCVLASSALFYARQGTVELGLELYELARSPPQFGTSQWTKDAVGRYIDEAAAALPAQTVVAARARGRERDAQHTVVELLEALRNPS